MIFLLVFIEGTESADVSRALWTTTPEFDTSDGAGVERLRILQGGRSGCSFVLPVVITGEGGFTVSRIQPCRERAVEYFYPPE